MKTELAHLARLSRRTAWRVRLDDTLGRAAKLLPVPLLYAAFALTFIKVVQPSAAVERVMIGLGLLPALLVVVGAAHAWLRRRPRHFGAMALDRYHGLKDRITNALFFNEEPKENRTPLMQAAIADALATAKNVSPRRAAPLHFPPEILVAAALGGGLYGLSLLEVRTMRVVEPTRSDFEPLAMSPDDVELFRDVVSELDKTTESPDVKTAVRRFNELIEDIAENRVDRREVFRRMEEIERGLLEATGTDATALDEALEGMAQELKKSELGKPIGEAMEQRKLADAEKAMRELAEKLRDRKQNVDKARLEQLRQALAKASRSNTEKSEKIDAERQELEEQRKRLLKKKEKEGLSKEEQKELERLDRRLERLTREKRQAEGAKKQLSKLDQDLARAASELMKELGESAKNLEKSAEDLNQVARQKMSDKEKQDLKQRLEELRQLLRQQGQAGREQLQRLMRFGQRARGGQQPGGQQGRSGKGQQGQGKGEQPGSGGKELSLGRGQGGKGVDVLMPGAGAPMPGQGEKPGDQGGGRGGGEQWGSGAGPDVRGDKSDLAGKTQDVTAAGVDTGQGPSTSEVIYGAADRGFTGRGYKKVFTDYQTVAEEVLNSDEIPAGYEFYVRRYFQLIRPRD